MIVFFVQGRRGRHDAPLNPSFFFPPSPLPFPQLSYAFYPDAFNRVTRRFKLDPRLLGTNALRGLQTAYSYNAASPAAAFTALTGCALPPGGDFPSCAANSVYGPPTPGCAEYSAALTAFCAGASQNYDSAACAAALQAQPVDATGSVSAITARAFFAACYDFLAQYQSDNGLSYDAGSGALTNREYLVTGDALLSQTGGHEIIWLTL